MYCYKCGAAIPDDSNVCPVCGTKQKSLGSEINTGNGINIPYTNQISQISESSRKYKTTVAIVITISCLIVAIAVILAVVYVTKQKNNNNNTNELYAENTEGYEDFTEDFTTEGYEDFTEDFTEEESESEINETANALANNNTQHKTNALGTPALNGFSDTSKNSDLTSGKCTWGAIKGASGFEVKECYRYYNYDSNYENTVETNHCYFEESSTRWMYVRVKVRAYKMSGEKKIYSAWSNEVQCTLNGESGDKNPIKRHQKETEPPTIGTSYCNLRGIVTTNGVSGYKRSYIIESSKKKVEKDTPKGQYLYADSYAYNYGNYYYECYDAKTNKYLGWVDGNYIDWDDNVSSDVDLTATIASSCEAFSDDYVMSAGSKNTLSSFVGGEKICCKQKIHTRGVNWYACYQVLTDEFGNESEGSFYGWVDENYIEF